MGSVRPDVKKPCTECYYLMGDVSKGTDRVTCMHPKFVTYTVNFVTGDVTERHPSCEAMRAGECGEAGSLFVSKKTRPADLLP